MPEHRWQVLSAACMLGFQHLQFEPGADITRLPCIVLSGLLCMSIPGGVRSNAYATFGVPSGQQPELTVSMQFVVLDHLTASTTFPPPVAVHPESLHCPCQQFQKLELQSMGRAAAEQDEVSSVIHTMYMIGVGLAGVSHAMPCSFPPAGPACTSPAKSVSDNGEVTELFADTWMASCERAKPARSSRSS